VAIGVNKSSQNNVVINNYYGGGGMQGMGGPCMGGGPMGMGQMGGPMQMMMQMMQMMMQMMQMMMGGGSQQCMPGQFPGMMPGMGGGMPGCGGGMPGCGGFTPGMCNNMGNFLGMPGGSGAYASAGPGGASAGAYAGAGPDGANGAGGPMGPGKQMSGGQYDQIINEASQQYGVPAALIKAVVKNESNFNPNARSHCGAQGLMQLMPGTARDLGVLNAYDPAQNIDGGAKYIRQLLDRFNGDLTKAIAGYNAGPGAVEQHGGVPPYEETQDYVVKVMGNYRNYTS